MRVPGGPNPIRRRNGLTLPQAVMRRLLKEDVHGLVDNGLMVLATELIDVAIQLSSGTVDSRKAGRPYSKAKPNTAFDPALINVGFEKHKGKRFADSWELLPKTQGPGIRNTSVVAQWLEHGTRRMVARPIDVLIRKQADQIYTRCLDQAFASDGTLRAA